MADCVLDSSALLALFYKEPGHEVVRPLLDNAAMATINLAEVASKLAERKVDEAFIQRYLGMLPIELNPLDRADAIAAGLLLPITSEAGLSLGDRCCLALAQRLAIPVITADRAWPKVCKKLGIEVRMIR